MPEGISGLAVEVDEAAEDEDYERKFVRQILSFQSKQ